MRVRSFCDPGHPSDVYGVMDYEYDVVTKNEIFSVKCNSMGGGPIFNLVMDEYEEYRSIVRQAINYMHLFKNYNEWKETLERENTEFDLYNYSSEINSKFQQSYYERHK